MPPHRFEVLDSWRGICALMVALLHFEAFSHLKDMPFFNDTYLFVDFFFVLSGFVIAANYQARLGNGFGVTKFMLLRFGRLYPLYFVMLIAFFALEITDGWSGAFVAPRKSVDTVFANLFLFQSFGIYDFLTWNTPGWSIATEFWTCLLFAFIATWWPRKLNVILILAACVSLTLIFFKSAHGMNVTYDYGMVRCLAGFAIGVLTYAVWNRLNAFEFDERLAFVLEVMCVVFTILFVAAVWQSNYSILAPLVFAIVVLVFAAERGPVSSLLKSRGFLILGAFSYSIYMVHLLVEMLLVDAAKYADVEFGFRLITKFQREDSVVDMLGLNQWQGDIWVVVLLVTLVAISALTYRWIEVPSRNWFRQLAQTARP